MARGIRGRLAEMTFESYTPPCEEAVQALADCVHWAENPEGVLVLTGGFGTGKTHLALSILRHAGGRYFTMADLVSEIQKGYNSKTETDTEIIKALGEEPILALDEVGRQRASDDSKYQVQRVMDERYIMKRPTVLVSNLPPDQIAENLGPQIADRLAECRKIIRFEWKSFRREPK